MQQRERLGLANVLELAFASAADLDVASLLGGLEDVARLGADEQLFAVNVDLLDVLVLGVGVSGLALVAAGSVVFGGRELAVASLGHDTGVEPGTHVSSHGEGVEVVEGLGVDVGCKLGLEVVSDVGHDVLEDLLLGSRPCEAGLRLLGLGLDGLLGLGLGLLLLGSGRRRCSSSMVEDAVAEGYEVATSCGNVGVGGVLVCLGDTLEVVLGLASRKEGVLHLLRDSAGAGLGLGVDVVLVRGRRRGRGRRRRRHRGRRRCRGAVNETEGNEKFLRKLARIVGERVSACREVVHGIRDLLVQDSGDRRR